MAKVTGRKLNQEIALGAQQARFHRDGYWFDQLHTFPGALFDRDGYVLFETKMSYEGCRELHHPVKRRADGRPGTLDAPNGIAHSRVCVGSTRCSFLPAFLGVDAHC
jgi:hypothetical protein